VASKATRDALFLDRYRAAELPYVDIAIAVLVGWRWPSICGACAGSMRARRPAFFFAAEPVLVAERGMAEEGRFHRHYLWVRCSGLARRSGRWRASCSPPASQAIVQVHRQRRQILGWIVGSRPQRHRPVARHRNAAAVGGGEPRSSGLVQLLWRRGGIAAVDQTSAPPGLRESVRHIAGSPYLRAIAWVIGLASFATTIAGWQFKAIAKAEIPDTDQLAAFFGLFNMLAGGASLVMQLVLTGRVLRTAGVGVALFIVPLAMASTSMAVLVLGRSPPCRRSRRVTRCCGIRSTSPPWSSSICHFRRRRPSA
jgi:hypothetical protein